MKRKNEMIAKRIASFAAALLLACGSLLALPIKAAATTYNGRIVFSKDTGGSNFDLYTMDSDGSNVCLLNQGVSSDVRSKWSPDGTKVVFESLISGHKQIFVIDTTTLNCTPATSGESMSLTSTSNSDNTDPQWSPDGNTIIYNNNLGGTTRIWTVPATGGTATEEFTSTVGNMYEPAFAPNGTDVVYDYINGSTRNLQIRNINTEAPVTTVNDTSKSQNNPIFNSAGDKLMYSDGSDIYEADVSAISGISNDRNITFRTSGNSKRPVYSPDGTKIAFQNDKDGEFEIYTLDLNGSKASDVAGNGFSLAQLTNDSVDESGPSWQPTTTQPVVGSVAIGSNVASPKTNQSITLTATPTGCTPDGTWHWTNTDGDGSPSTTNTLVTSYQYTGSHLVTAYSGDCNLGTTNITVTNDSSSVGCTTSNANTTFMSGSTFYADINGATECTQYDRYLSNGVTLDNPNLVVSVGGGYTPAVGTKFKILSNLSGSPTNGTTAIFNSYPEGTIFTVSGVTFQITYQDAGPDTVQNDVALTVVTPPATPTITVNAPTAPSGGFVTGTAYTFTVSTTGCSTNPPTTGWAWTATNANAISSTSNSVNITWPTGTEGSGKVVHATNGGACSGASNTDATVTIVAPSVTPTITLSPSTASGTTGNPITFTASCSNATLTSGWVWSLDGGTFTDTAGSNIYHVSWASATPSTKNLSVSNPGCSGASNGTATATITASSTPTITVTPTPSTAATGTAVSFTAVCSNASLTSGWSWTATGQTVSSTSNTISLTWAAGTEGPKTVSASNSGCTGASAGSANITITAPSSGGGSTGGSSAPTTTTDTDGNKSSSVADSQDFSSTNYTVSNKETLTNNGKLGNVTVASGGTLKGHGSFGAVVVQSGGSLSPGNSPGCQTMTSLAMGTGTTLVEEIGGTNATCNAADSFDQITVNGTVDVTNAALNISLYNGFVPKVGDSFTIVNNDGTDAVTGTFQSLAEGATVTVSGVIFKVSYVGGSGNDIVLTVQSVPGTPNTGLRLGFSNPIFTLVTTTMLAAGIYAIANKRRLLNNISFKK